MEDHPSGGKFKVPSFLVPTHDSILKEPESWNSNNEQGQDNPVMEKVGRLSNSFVITPTPPVEIVLLQNLCKSQIQKHSVELIFQEPEKLGPESEKENGLEKVKLIWNFP